METADQVLVALRRILRAIDIHSRNLAQEQGLTVPQLIVLRAIAQRGTPTTGELARAVSLSNATLTSILDRMERHQMVKRSRSDVDRRRVHVEITPKGQALLDRSPSLLHDRFLEQYGQLKEWEQTLILSSLQRVAEMMDQEGLKVAPLLTAEALDANDAAALPSAGAAAEQTASAPAQNASA